MARNDSEDARAALAASRQAGVPVLVTTATLAEALFGNERDARVNRVLKGVQVTGVTEPIARSAARLKRLAGMTGVAATIDAIVVATSLAAGGGIVLTSDPDDIRSLAGSADGVRIKPVSV